MKFLNIECENISLDKESLILKGYKWILLYNYDSIIADDLEKVDFNIDNLLEARIFNHNRELHLFKNEKLNIVEFEEENDRCITREHIIINDKFGGYNKIGVKNYISFDKDNQAYISYTRPYMLIKE